MLEATPTPSPDCSAPPPEAAAPPNENAPRPNPKSAFRNPQLVHPWQKISGLLPDKEATFSRSERRYALRKLFRHFEQLVRDALIEHQTDPEKDERTFLWDPLETICIELGIARRKLSALTKELTGMSATEVIDRLRAAELPEKFEASLAQQIRFDGGDWALRERLFDGKPPAGRDLGHWAVENGFSSYNRFRRGCMLAHGGKTPRLLERAVVATFQQYFNLVSSLRHRAALVSFKDNWDKPDERRINAAGRPFDDAWAGTQRERPDWLHRMRALLGLEKDYEDLAALDTCPPLTDDEQALVKKWADRRQR